MRRPGSDAPSRRRARKSSAFIHIVFELLLGLDETFAIRLREVYRRANARTGGSSGIRPIIGIVVVVGVGRPVVPLRVRIGDLAAIAIGTTNRRQTSARMRKQK